MKYYEEIDPRLAVMEKVRKKRRPRPNVYMTPKERRLNKMLLEQIKLMLRYNGDIDAYVPTEETLQLLEIEVDRNDYGRLNSLIARFELME